MRALILRTDSYYSVEVIFYIEYNNVATLRVLSLPVVLENYREWIRIFKRITIIRVNKKGTFILTNTKYEENKAVDI